MSQHSADEVPWDDSIFVTNSELTDKSFQFPDPLSDRVFDEILTPDGHLTVIFTDGRTTNYDFDLMGPKGWHWCNDRNALVISYQGGEDTTGRIEIPRESIKSVTVTNNSNDYMRQQEIRELQQHIKDLWSHYERASAKLERLVAEHNESLRAS